MLSRKRKEGVMGMTFLVSEMKWSENSAEAPRRVSQQTASRRSGSPPVRVGAEDSRLRNWWRRR